MVSQTKVDARNDYGKPDPIVRKGMQQDAAVGNEGSSIDQAAAAAVVDADQAGTVAAQLTADGGILPTEAPAPGIGELAQVSEPTTTGTTTTTTETTPPPVVEEAAPVSPWVMGGIALLGVGAIAIAVNNDDDDDDSPPVAVEPPPAPPPAVPPPAAPPPVAEPPAAPPPVAEPPPAPPPANVPPTSVDAAVATTADGSTVIPPSTFQFVDTDGGTFTSVRIDAITPTPFDDADPATAIFPGDGGHGYQLVSAPSGITWTDAQADAVARGGYLAVVDTPAESIFLEDNFDLGANAVTTENPFGNNDGTWVGASQAPGSAEPGEGWTWVDGSDLPAASTIWNGPAPANFTTGATTAEFAAIYNEAGGDPEGNVYDYGVATDTLARYVIEYNTPNAGPLTLDGAEVAPGAVIAVADLETLAWNSVFNTGGTVSFSVSDGTDFSAAPPNTLTLADAPPVGVTSNSLAMMIEDPTASAVI